MFFKVQRMLRKGTIGGLNLLQHSTRCYIAVAIVVRRFLTSRVVIYTFVFFFVSGRQDSLVRLDHCRPCLHNQFTFHVLICFIGQLCQYTLYRLSFFLFLF